MKQCIKSLVIAAGRLIGLFCPSGVREVRESLLAYLHTGIVCRSCKSWGRGSTLGRGGTITNPQYVSVGTDNIFLRDCAITATPDAGKHAPEIVIGSHCHFGLRNHITCVRKISIGDYLLTGSYVLISDNAHGPTTSDMLGVPPLSRPLVSKGEVHIGDYVWIGDKVTVLAGVRIGNNVVVGANSVVTKDVPDNCVVAGIPAKVIKRFGQ